MKAGSRQPERMAPVHRLSRDYSVKNRSKQRKRSLGLSFPRIGTDFMRSASSERLGGPRRAILSPSEGSALSAASCSTAWIRLRCAGSVGIHHEDPKNTKGADITHSLFSPIPCRENLGSGLPSVLRGLRALRGELSRGFGMATRRRSAAMPAEGRFGGRPDSCLNDSVGSFSLSSRKP